MNELIGPIRGTIHANSLLSQSGICNVVFVIVSKRCSIEPGDLGSFTIHSGSGIEDERMIAANVWMVGGE